MRGRQPCARAASSASSRKAAAGRAFTTTKAALVASNPGVVCERWLRRSGARVRSEGGRGDERGPGHGVAGAGGECVVRQSPSFATDASSSGNVAEFGPKQAVHACPALLACRSSAAADRVRRGAAAPQRPHLRQKQRAVESEGARVERVRACLPLICIAAAVGEHAPPQARGVGKARILNP